MTKGWDAEGKKAYYREYFKKRRAKCKEDGICVSCIKRPAEPGKYSCQQCLEDKKLCSKFGKAGPYRQIYADIFERQGGKCAICGDTMLKPVLDHCHATMEVRGLLCSACNVGLGQFKDNPSLLLSAIRYLNNKDNAWTGVTLRRNSTNST